MDIDCWRSSGRRDTAIRFRAIQPRVGRDVEVEVFHEHVASAPTFVERFESEAQAVAALEHPHVVPIYDYWREPGRAYLVWRHVRGPSLSTLVERGEVFDLGRALLVDRTGGVRARRSRTARTSPMATSATTT